MAALADEVQVELADRRQEAVRVVDGDGPRLRVVDLEPVRERQLGALGDTLEHARRMDALELDGLAVGGDGAHGGGGRPVGTDDHAAVGRVGAQHAVRVAVLPVDEALEVLSGGEGHARSVPTPAPSRL